MINPKTNERELAYFVQVDDVIPHNNADRLEIAVVGGWHVIVGKGEFKKGDLGVYFEIDSQLPEEEPFTSMEFLASKHFRIKTQKIRGELSQGFLCHPSIFKGTSFENICKFAEEINKHLLLVDLKKELVRGIIPEDFILSDEEKGLSVSCTSYLKVKYYVAEDNERKSNQPKHSVDKYKRMAQRNYKLFSKPFFRYLMRTWWGKRILFLIFGRKRDSKKAQWPLYVKKTDEERIQNMPWILKDKSSWVVTEKIDGTSLTVTWKPEGEHSGLYICSRNLAFTEDDDNLYVRTAKKYHIPEAIKALCEEYGLEYVTFQGEIYGKSIQVRDYGLPDGDLRVAGFNLILSDRGRLNSVNAKKHMEMFGNIPWVPILDESYILPDTIEELLAYVESENSKIDGGMREGLVFRSQDGTKSFKVVSNKFLLKYHN